MRRMVEKLFLQYGIPIRVGETEVRGFLQPVTGKLERLSRLVPGYLGLDDRSRYIYIGPVEPLPRLDQELTAGERRYLVRAAEVVNGSRGPAYCWAMCIGKGRLDDGI